MMTNNSLSFEIICSEFHLLDRDFLLIAVANICKNTFFQSAMALYFDMKKIIIVL